MNTVTKSNQKTLSIDEIYATIQTLDNLVIKHPSYVEAEKRVIDCYEKSQKYGVLHHTSCWGLSGTGKSTLLKSIKKRYPPVTTDDRVLQPVVTATAPSAPTAKRLAEAVLEAIGDEKFAIGVQKEKTDRIKKLFEELEVKLLILDELQQVVDQNNSQTLWDVTDWLKRLVLDTNTCIVLLGLHRGKKVITRNSLLTRRFNRHMSLPPFSISTKTEADTFASVLNLLLKKLPIPMREGDMTNDFIKRFYYATEGIIDYMVKLVGAAFESAGLAGKTVLSIKHFEGAFKEVVWSDVTPNYNPFSSTFTFCRLVKDGQPFSQWEKEKMAYKEINSAPKTK